MKILDYNIPTELEGNRYIQSLDKQAKVRKLTAPQLEVLSDMLGIETHIDTYETQTVKKYIRYFYRLDYHGDELRDSDYVYNVEPNRVYNKIQDGHAAQYGTESYEDEYKYIGEQTIPANITNVTYFMNEHYEDYEFLVKKIERNKFRKVTTKNIAIRALNSLTGTKDVDTKSIERATGKNFGYQR